MKKNIQNNTDLKDLTNSRTLVDLVNRDAFMAFPDKESWRKRFVFTMYKWAEKDTSLDIVQFCFEMKITRSWLYALAEKHQEIGEALKEVRLWLGCRRRVGSMLRKYDKDAAYKDMHRLDPEWKEVDSYHAALKNEDNSPNNITIRFADVPRTLEVPELVQIEEKKDDIK